MARIELKVPMTEFPSQLVAGTRLYVLVESHVVEPITDWFLDDHMQCMGDDCADLLYIFAEVNEATGEYEMYWSEDPEYCNKDYNWAIYRCIL